MPSRPASSDDSAALARLHAALDAVLETELLIRELRESAPSVPLSRAALMVKETRELLRSMLAPPLRQVSGT